ncbi:MAG TPA: pyruvate/2-oxoglutarate dehydrogenase complex,dihydrolipoamide dehydrogenase (E3) component [Cyanothece sp. UBA12306]|nr:pyruvate/2-oxoglutarate dehydrogenase complex,dihydrolipoamide dehydrogenase (E3) component [Cyanothece sp. UBA12306]
MKLLDSKGRLFGKVSILDFGAALIILLVIVGIFVVPGKSGVSTIAQVAKKPIEVDVIVRGLGVSNPESLIEQFNDTKKTNIVIRNQPAGEVKIKSVQPLPRTTVVPQPDGSVKALPDPRPEVVFFKDMIITLEGQAQMTDTGAVLGNQKVKIGTLIELEGKDYNFNTSTIDVRILN